MTTASGSCWDSRSDRTAARSEFQGWRHQFHLTTRDRRFDRTCQLARNPYAHELVGLDFDGRSVAELNVEGNFAVAAVGVKESVKPLDLFIIHRLASDVNND